MMLIKALDRLECLQDFENLHALSCQSKALDNEKCLATKNYITLYLFC